MQEMTAIEISAPGGAEMLQPTKRPIPKPAPGEALIKVAAAGVNRPDILQRMGLYPAPEGASDLPGLEVSGEIIAVGPDTNKDHIGQSVCALLPGGGYAEYAIADLGSCLPIPHSMDVVSAAALPETFFTVWANVFEDGKLQKDQRLLVHGGTSGIGTTAIAMAHAIGASTVATAGNDEKCTHLQEMGVSLPLNYKSDDWEKEILSYGGVDVVLDMVGGEYVNKNLNCLKPGGRHITIAFLGGAMAEINMMHVMRKRLIMTGSTLRARAKEEKGRLALELKKNIWPFLDSGKITPVIDSTFPLENAADAHRKMEESSHIGKILLTVGSTS